MRQHLYGKVAALLLFSGCFAPVARADVTLEATVSSDYIFRGINMYNSLSPVFTPSFTWTAGHSGLEISTWAYLAMTNRSNDWIDKADEVDATVSYVRDFGAWQGCLGLYHLSLPKQAGWPSTKTTVSELFAELGRPDWPGMPVVAVNYELDTWKNHDTYFQLRLGHELPLEGKTLLFLGSSIGFWSYGYDSVPNFTDVPFNWTRRERITDVNFEVATTVPLGSFALMSSIVMTLSPDKVINANQMVVWGSLKVSRAIPGR